MKRFRTAARVVASTVGAAFRWIGATFGAREVHTYGGLAVLAFALASTFGPLGLSVPAALLFAIGVFGVARTRNDQERD